MGSNRAVPRYEWTPEWDAHHLVSRGWQQNFAQLPDKRVAILDARTGRLLDGGRPIKTNWARPGFSSFIDADGNRDSRLEEEWASIERTVLNEIRRVGPGPCTGTQAGAIVNLLAIHLVRSPSYEAKHARVATVVENDVAGSIQCDEEVIAMFARDTGRLPDSGELDSMVRESMQRAVRTRQLLIVSQVRQHNGIGDQLSRYHVQVITTGAEQPGFALGDVPAVHVNTTTGQYGFRDDLAVGDANLIMAPLDRHTAVFLSWKALPPQVLRKKWQVQSINALTLRAALAEVACHPSDVLELRRVAVNLGRFPASKLIA